MRLAADALLRIDVDADRDVLQRAVGGAAPRPPRAPRRSSPRGRSALIRMPAPVAVADPEHRRRPEQLGAVGERRGAGSPASRGRGLVEPSPPARRRSRSGPGARRAGSGAPRRRSSSPARKPAESWRGGVLDARRRSGARVWTITSPPASPRPERPASWATIAKVRSSARKSGKRRVASASRIALSVTSGKSWPLATIWVPTRTALGGLAEAGEDAGVGAALGGGVGVEAEDRHRVEALGQQRLDPLGPGAGPRERRRAALRAGARLRARSGRSGGRRGGRCGGGRSARRRSWGSPSGGRRSGR